MSVLSNTGIRAGASGAGGDAGYKVANSLRFNSDDSAYLNKTFGAGNRMTWTWSGWVKRSSLDTYNYFFTARSASTNYYVLSFTNDAIKWYNRPTTGTHRYATSEALFRDPSAWYHVVLAWDTTEGTDSDRAKLYVNGERITDYTMSSWPTEDEEGIINNNHHHEIGAYNSGGSYEFDGYLADVHFVDGTALDASSFAEEDATTGQWVPKDCSGDLTYGTNGFYLKFNNTSDLGEDSAGSNDWTANSFSTSAGTGNDVLADSPTAYDDGGNGVGNYCTWNPLKNSSGTYSNGNLQLLTTAGSRHYQASFGLTSGKWYWEVEPDAGATPGMIGIALGSKAITDNLNGAGAMSYYSATGYKQGGNTSGVDASYGATYTYGDIIGVALDLDSATKTLTFYKNGASQGVAFNPDVTLGDWFPAVCAGSSVNTTTFIVNFGQRPFVYTPPTNYKALNSYNT